MSWGLSILIGVLTAAVGAFAVGATADRHAYWHAMSNFEGASGYFVAFMGLLGIIAGLITGIVVSRFHTSFAMGLATSVGGLIAVCAFVALLSRVTGESAPEYEGSRVNVLMEYRTPRGWQPDHATEGDKNSATLIPAGGGRQAYGTIANWQDAAHREGDTWIIEVFYYLHTSTASKYVRLNLGKKSDVMCELPVQKIRAEQFNWSEWTEIPSSGGFAYRYRLQKAVNSYLEREKAEKEHLEVRQKELEAMRQKGGGNIEGWTRLLYKQSDEAAEKARQEIAGRLDELVPLLESTQIESIALAVHAWERVHPEQVSERAAVALLQAGPVIEKEILAINAAANPEDPDLKRERIASETFRAWRECLVRTAENKSTIRRTLESILAAAKASSRTEGALLDIVYSIENEFNRT